MQQVLFWIPINPFGYFPEGIPVNAYGTMLFLTIVTCIWYMSRRAAQLGIDLSRDKVQDMDIVVFIAGLAGARLTYMWQFGVPWYKFFRIWEGGIVLYGGIIGGTVAFILFHRYVLRPLKITLWQMGDLAGPTVAIGIAIGRIGCLLNGCCWGNVAGADCPAIEFPMLTGPAREMLVDHDGLQTVTGFLIRRDRDDVRTVVGKIELDSAAAKAGLKEGDRIIKLKIADEWLVNGEVLILSGPTGEMTRARDDLKTFGTITEIDPVAAGETTLKLVVDKPESFASAYQAAQVAQSAAAGRNVLRLDLFSDLLNNWPRGRNSVAFVVERQGAPVEIPAFTPRSVGLHPTQLYETISMVLILFLLLAFYPFRRHDGQVWVLFMVLYSIHRFLNEILRTEPIEGFKMTLSQNISVAVLLVAIGLEIYLRKTQPKRA